MKKMLKRIFGIFGVAFVALTSAAQAAVDLTTFTVDVSAVETLAGIVLVGLAAMWAIRKLIKTINRS